MNLILKNIFIVNILSTCIVFNITADVITNFDSKKDIKYSLFGFDQMAPPEKFQHWIYDGKVSASPIAFEPPSLDFPETPIGQPKWEHVKIMNEDESSTIKLISISSNTIDFHCSFFKEEVIIEGGNSSFDVVFLSRQLGEIKSTLFIHTSKGTFQYKVSAVGIPSPYRIKTFLKARIPLNSSFSSPIYFYNPYNYPIQILEMYTSGGDAHLELPSNGKQASKKFWMVPPYETRILMKVKFLGRKVGNFTSFIRIRTNTTDNTLGFVIPLQIEISKKFSLYCTNDMLYFGILRTLDSPKALKLLVINSAKQPIRIKNISLSKPNDAITIDFRQINVPPGIYQQTIAATVTFSAYNAISDTDFSGIIIIETFQNQTLKMPFLADIIHGSLVYDANNTKFFAEKGVSKTEKRIIAITNTFDFTIAIYSISLPSKTNLCFKIVNITLPIIIKPQMTDKSIEVQFTMNDNVYSLITQIAIFSNASLFVIPLFVYDGKLTIISHRPEMYKGYLDFGTLGFNINSALCFTIKNENPAEIILLSMSSNWYMATIFLIGVEKGNNTFMQKNSSHEPMNNFIPLILKPYHFAVFQLKVQTPDTKGVFASDISIVTAYEKISIPYYLRTTDGVILNVNPLVLKYSFPSKISKLMLTLNSSFQSYIELTSVTFKPYDIRFYFDPKPGRKLPILINPTELTNVGYVTFTPDSLCIDPLSNEFIDLEKPTSQIKTDDAQFRILNEINGKVPCYAGFNVCTKLGYQWLNSAEMNSKTYDIDHFVYNRLYQQWTILKSSDNHIFNVTMQMDTSNIKGFLYNIQIQFMWPSLISSKIIKFPLTQIGNCSFKDIYLENPSDKFVITQLILISHYSDPYSLLGLLGISGKDINIYDSEVFTLHPKKLTNEEYTFSESILESNKIKKMFSISPHNNSMMIYLSSKTKYKIRIYFNPTQAHYGSKVSTFVLFRNNLTGIETLRLEGEGTYGELSFQGGQFPEETSVLNFDLTEKHLKSCDSQSKGLLPSFTVRRPFVIKNIGRIPVYILGFKFGPSLNLNENQGVIEIQINDSHSVTFPTVFENVKTDVENPGESMWCAGYGFEILECYEHRLEVNETLKLEIVFTPDFSLHKVIQQLQIHTSLSERPFNITVHATLPAHMLYRCSQALARPDSEVLIWYMVIVVLSVVSVVSIIMSYYEADRIFTSNVIYRHLSSVALGSYSHSTNDRVCDFRTLVSRSSPFIGVSSQLHVPHKSSVQDYMSMYNRYNGETNTIKRTSVCKKLEDRVSNGITEKQFSQSFCGRNISDDVINSECNVTNTLFGNSIHQHKKKKKRGLFGCFLQWIFRSCNQIANQNSALKPKLDNNYRFSYKTDMQQIAKPLLLNRAEEMKCDFSNKLCSGGSKIKASIVQDNAVTNILTQSNITNSCNNNHSNTSKKLKNRPSYILGMNTNKVVNKSNDQTVSTLNFAPIDIPALDLHKCKKNQVSKKLKKNCSVSTEEIKIKNSLKIDDNISVSTDSSMDEKIKDIDANKYSKTNLILPPELKEEFILIEGAENKFKTNICFELDEEFSNISNDSVVESTRKSNCKFNKDTLENNESLRNNSKVVDQNSNMISKNENLKKKIKIEPTTESKRVYNGKSKAHIDKRNIYDSNMTIKEDNDVEISVLSIIPTKPDLFSNFVTLNENASVQKSNIDIKPIVNLKSNVESWLSTTTVPFSNPIGQCELKNEDGSNIYVKRYNPSYSDDLFFQTDHLSNTQLTHYDGSRSQYPMFHHFCKEPTTVMAHDNFGNNRHQNLCQDDLFNQDLSNFMSLELPGIAHGRKQSLLEYERRIHKGMNESERILPVKEYDNFGTASNSVDQYWDINQSSESSNKIWNNIGELSNHDNNIMNNSIWLTEKCWNHIEPGSQHDPLARTLLPIGLLSNDTSNGLFSNSDNLWKFESIDTSLNQSNDQEGDLVEK